LTPALAAAMDALAPGVLLTLRLPSALAAAAIVAPTGLSRRGAFTSYHGPPGRCPSLAEQAAAAGVLATGRPDALAEAARETRTSA